MIPSEEAFAAEIISTNSHINVDKNLIKTSMTPNMKNLLKIMYEIPTEIELLKS